MGWLADGVNHSSNRFERQYEDIANALDPTRRATHGSPVTVRALFPFSSPNLKKAMSHTMIFAR